MREGLLKLIAAVAGVAVAAFVGTVLPALICTISIAMIHVKPRRKGRKR